MPLERSVRLAIDHRNDVVRRSQRLPHRDCRRKFLLCNFFRTLWCRQTRHRGMHLLKKCGDVVRARAGVRIAKPRDGQFRGQLNGINVSLQVIVPYGAAPLLRDGTCVSIGQPSRGE